MATKRLTFNGITQDCPIGVVTSIDGLDILPFSTETMLINGNVDLSPRSVSGILESDGQMISVNLDWLQAQRVGHVPLTARMRNFSQPFWTLYLADRSDDVDVSNVTGATWGPVPDDRVTKASGSGRLWANRCPAAAMAMAGYDVPDPWPWLDEQLRRCVHAYRVDDDGRMTPWDPDDDPSWNLSGPYGSAIGGFREDEGPQWPHIGWPCCDWKHATLTTTEIAAAYGSRVAYMHSVMHWNAMVSGVGKEAHNSPRGMGHMLREGAKLHALTPGVSIRGLTRCLAVVQEKLDTSDGHSWLDAGNMSDGPGHIGAADPDMQAAAKMLNVPVKECAKSLSAFELGILAVGLEAVDRYCSGGKATFDVSVIAAAVAIDLTESLTRPAWDRNGSPPKVIAPSIMWEDLAPLSRLTTADQPVADSGHNADGAMSKSVLGRFTETGMRALLQMTPGDSQLVQLLAKCVAYRGTRSAERDAEAWY